MPPFEAEVGHCATEALKGNLRACIKFISLCLRQGLIVKSEYDDGHQYVIIIPKDWDQVEFMAMYHKFGPPPWRGPRDGLTTEERERQKDKARR